MKNHTMIRSLVNVAMVIAVMAAANVSIAQTISYVGEQLSLSSISGTGGGNALIRGTDLAKPLDIDGNDEFGTDGTAFPLAAGLGNFSANPPSYATAVADGSDATLSGSGGNMLDIDNPTLSGADPANINSTWRYTAGNWNGEAEMMTVTLGGTIPSVFRVGVFIDNHEFAHGEYFHPDAIRVAIGANDASKTVPDANRGADGDIYLFDVSGAQAGDVLRIFTTENGGGGGDRAMLGGVTFDSAPAATPGTLIYGK